MYAPLKTSSLSEKHNITLPHEDSEKPFNSQKYIKECDLMIAEVSLPSTGLGIEMGWAHTHGVPIVAIHKVDNKVGRSISVVTDNIISYTSPENMLQELERYFASLNQV